MPLSPLAAALAGVVAAARTVRVPVEALRAAAADADLSMRGDADARRLADAIDELAAAGLVTLPKAAALWQHSPRPPLPTWVARPTEPRVDRPRQIPVAWHAALSWVPAFLAEDRPTPGEQALLRAANAWLGAGASRLVVPLRERSLQLTGDEKALDVASRGRLFIAGRLRLELLAARRTSPPVADALVGRGAVALLVENWATFESLAAALPPDGSIGRLVYSAGNTLGVVLSALADAPPQELAYFGDLDTRGLEIPASGAHLAGQLGLPRLTAAAGLYRLLLEHGRPAPAETRPDAHRVTRAVGWLPAALRPHAQAVLAAGERLAQEAVGLELLTTVGSDTLRILTSDRS